MEGPGAVGSRDDPGTGWGSFSMNVFGFSAALCLDDSTRVQESLCAMGSGRPRPFLPPPPPPGTAATCWPHRCDTGPSLASALGAACRSHRGRPGPGTCERLEGPTWGPGTPGAPRVGWLVTRRAQRWPRRGEDEDGPWVSRTRPCPVRGPRWPQAARPPGLRKART